MIYYSAVHGGFYDTRVHGEPTLPADAVEISSARHAELLAGNASGQQIVPDANGQPVLVDLPQPPVTAANLCNSIDSAADAARYAVAGDPLRAVEYDRARIEAEAFATAGYQGAVPRTVAAWAINGRTLQQAADSILAEAAAYTEALYFLRETRLQAKEQIRTAMAAGNVELAEDITAETIASIEAAVAGIGNNAGT